MAEQPRRDESAGGAGAHTVGDGRYELGGRLGRGGMAEVFMARDVRLGRTVAVKTLRADLAQDPVARSRFSREAQNAASLNHPAIVSVYDTGEDLVGNELLPFIVMECVHGRTIREVLSESDDAIALEQALHITEGVLEALEYSHRSGIIHRDIKPANVIITDAGAVKVMDFGIARAMHSAATTMTATGMVMGTPQYLSPEQALGRTVDTRSDLYSTGCMLYELLALRPPFNGDTPLSVVYQHVQDEPRPPSSIDARIPPHLDAIALKALAKDPDHRYQSADEMRMDIRRAMHGQQVSAAVGAPRSGTRAPVRPPVAVPVPAKDEDDYTPAWTPAAAAAPTQVAGGTAAPTRPQPARTHDSGATAAIPQPTQGRPTPVDGSAALPAQYGDGDTPPPPRREEGGDPQRKGPAFFVMVAVGLILVVIGAVLIAKELAEKDKKPGENKQNSPAVTDSPSAGNPTNTQPGLPGPGSSGNKNDDKPAPGPTGKNTTNPTPTGNHGASSTPTGGQSKPASTLPTATKDNPAPTKTTESPKPPDPPVDPPKPPDPTSGGGGEPKT